MADQRPTETDAALEEIQAARLMLEQLDARLPGIQQAIEESVLDSQRHRERTWKVILGVMMIGILLTGGSAFWALRASSKAETVAAESKELARQVEEVQQRAAWDQYDALIAGCERGNDAVDRALGTLRTILDGLVQPDTPQDVLDAAFGPLDALQPRNCVAEIQEPPHPRL